MPIRLDFQPEPISYDDYHALDYKVMGIAFSIHRDMGRLWNEKIYQNALARRCRKAGIENVATEVPIYVSYNDFTKLYKIDILIGNVIYEMKAAQTLTGEHEKQTINYLMLTGLRHAKLINMRPSSVKHRFVTTNITPGIRFDFTIDDAHWQELDESSVWLKKMLKNLIAEWGTFLELTLFHEAIVHFLGGEVAVIKEIEVRDGTHLLGKQKVSLLSPDVAFKFSAMTKDQKQYENHLRRFLRYTPLKAIHWINFNHEKVFLKTILK